MTDDWLGHFLRALPRDRAGREHGHPAALSDHGYLLGERGFTGKVPSQLHPELAQVPFVIVHPDGRAAGETSTYFASTHDVGPTLLSLAGIDGRTGWRAPTSPRARRTASRPSGATSTTAGMYNRFYIRTDDWLLIADNRGEERRSTTSAGPPRVLRRPEEHTALAEELYRRCSTRPAARCRTTSSASQRADRRPPTPATSAAPASRRPSTRSSRKAAASSAAITTLDSRTAATGAARPGAARPAPRRRRRDRAPVRSAARAQLGAQLPRAAAGQSSAA